MENHSNRIPKSYWIISVIATIWNAMGFYTFFTEYNLWKNPEARESFGELAAQYGPIYDATPGWIYVVFAVAVATGLLGSIGLLLKKKWSILFFLISLIAVLIQFSHNVLATNLIEVMGASAVVMPLVVIAIAAYLFYYARRNAGKGILT